MYMYGSVVFAVFFVWYITNSICQFCFAVLWCSAPCAILHMHRLNQPHFHCKIYIHCKYHNAATKEMISKLSWCLKMLQWSLCNSGLYCHIFYGERNIFCINQGSYVYCIHSKTVLSKSYSCSRIKDIQLVATLLAAN